MQVGRTPMVFAAIVVAVITGIMCAIRSGHFDLGRLAQFYRTNVVPYCLGWLMIYAFSYLSLQSLVGETWTNLVSYAGYVPALVSLGKSVTENIASLQNPVAPAAAVTVSSDTTLTVQDTTGDTKSV